ncbi:MAG: DUF86 domain-containing protein [Haliea sp.]|uniref:type VII toxin-antitoxin system HepT family RNase toxin n=1 Tax=Haliea sp. TaxID=1932666 RepID=UPI0032EE44E9
MDQLIIEQKMESLRRCIQRIAEKTPPDVSLLIRDPDLQDILVLNLTRVVQLCVDIGSHSISATDESAPTTMGEVFTKLEKLGVISPATSEAMRKAVGFRNVAVHNYEAINWEIVFAICSKFLSDFQRFVAEITIAAGR